MNGRRWWVILPLVPALLLVAGVAAVAAEPDTVDVSQERGGAAVDPAPSPSPSPPRRPRLISLDFKDADVVNVMRILAAESGQNIVISDDVKGKISIALRNVPWEQALATILEAKGLEKIERDGVIRIVSQRAAPEGA